MQLFVHGLTCRYVLEIISGSFVDLEASVRVKEGIGPSQKLALYSGGRRLLDVLGLLNGQTVNVSIPLRGGKVSLLLHAVL